MAAWRAMAVGLVLFGTCIVPAASGEDAGSAPVSSGMRAYIDPQTGRFVPAPVDASPAHLPAPPRPPVQAVTQPDGSIEVQFDERHRHNVVATVDADGKVHLGCAAGDPSHVHAGE